MIMVSISLLVATAMTENLSLNNRLINYAVCFSNVNCFKSVNQRLRKSVGIFASQYEIRTDLGVHGSLHPNLKIRTDFAVHGSLNLNF